MITRSEVARLLALIAAHDRRTTGQADVEAWYGVAVRAGWTYPTAVRAIEDFHDRDASQGMIRPAHVTDAITAARETVRRTLLHAPITPPVALADDPRAEIAWRRERIDQLVGHGLDAWAHRRDIPAPDTLPQPPASVPTAITHLAERTAVPNGDHPPHLTRTHPEEHRRRIENARAELDAIRDRTRLPQETDHA